MFNNNKFVGSALFDPVDKPATVVVNNNHPTVKGQTALYWYQQYEAAQQELLEAIDISNGNGAKAVERKAVNAGLRAVIRVLLSELGATNPNHPLLDKKIRDRVYKEFEQEQLLESINSFNGDPRYQGILAKISMNPGEAS